MKGLKAKQLKRLNDYKVIQGQNDNKTKGKGEKRVIGYEYKRAKGQNDKTDTRTTG